MKKLLTALLALGVHCAGAQIITTYAGTPLNAGYTGDGGMATTSELNSPRMVATDMLGNLYIADYQNNVVRKVTPTGLITTFAGTGAAGYSGDGGAASAAALHGPNGIAVDAAGNVYVSDIYNAVVRKISVAGIMSTFAGGGTTGLGDGGAATAAAMAGPCGIATDASGNIYIADGGNQRIRKVSASGIISTIAGTGAMGYTGDGGPATAAEVNYPNDLRVDASGNLLIADSYNNVVRKINTAGIISTIAGTGTAGHTGDGGLATAAEMYYPNGIVIDGVGNIYVTEASNSIVRKITPYNVISTFAGNGTSGYGGDGYSATLAQMAQPWGIAIDGSNNLYIADPSNSIVRKVKTSPDHLADSFAVYISNYCNGPFLTIVPNHYSAGMSVKTFWGDATSDSSAVSATWGAVFTHSYANSGSYTVKNVLLESGVRVDSMSYTYNYFLCNSIPVRFYMDFNGNCVMDSTDTYMGLPVLTEVDSNGVAIDTISSTSGFDYVAYGNVHDVYKFRIIGMPAGINYSCPSTGIVVDTLNNLSYSVDTAWVAMQCNSDTAFDLAVHMQTISGRHAATGTILVSNAYCTPVTAQVTMTFSPNYTFLDASPAPDSVMGNVAKWHLNAVSGSNPIARQIQFNLTHTGTFLTAGDTVMYTCSVAPMVGDVDTTNNNCAITDTIRSSWDPNEMMVSPSGCIDTGVHTLQYSIQFENTGNDTAFNISVLDTLSPYVNVSTMQMVTSSATMFVTKTTDMAGQHILKFDFPNINLLDSSHHGQCAGAVVFNIKTLSGMPIGTDVYSRAGIYFDDNAVVMTNTVGNQMGGCVSTSVATAPAIAGKVAVYPNPAQTQITIQAGMNAYQSVSITNTMGQELLQQAVTGTQTTVQVSGLAAGIYFIVLHGGNGTHVEKFVKL